MTIPLLEVHDLGCLRNDNRLFSGLSFSLVPGEILQVTGYNGSGKSSLLKLLSGLLPVEEGKVILDRDDLLYVGHKLGIKLALTVRENLHEMAVLYQAKMESINAPPSSRHLPLACFPFPSAVFPRLVRGIQGLLDPAHKPRKDGEVARRRNGEVARRKNGEIARGEGCQILEHLNLASIADRPCLYLSAGQKQRLALARLFFIKRKLWILDEPFAHLDQPNTDILREAMNQHCSQGGAIVLVTHRGFDFAAKQQMLRLS